MENVFIAGCGYAGSHIAAPLHDQGKVVWGLRRHPEELPDFIKGVQGDLTNISSLTDRETFPDEVDNLIFCASANAYSDQGYKEMYVDGLRNVVEMIRHYSWDLQRVFFTSSTGVYAQNDGSWVDEESVTEPEWYAGKRMLEAESILRESTFPHTILRLGGIYGPDRTRRIQKVKAGDAVCYEGPAYFSNMIHVRDIAGAVEHLISLSSPESLYNLVDSNPVDRCKVYRWLADQLEAAEPVTRSVDEASERLTQSNKRCSNNRLLESGYTFYYPSFRAGYGSILSEDFEEK